MKIMVSQAGQDKKMTVVALEGRIDALAADEVLATLRKAVNKGSHHLVINMAHATFISSSGLRVLLSIAKLIHQVGGTLLLANLSPRVRKVFIVSDLEDLFTFHDNVEQALASHGMARDESA
ncbi:MAG: STAS domain-containing protein [Deltaproteobacteria bacterium]|nr:STAS domain-containing protein [Deltaproteobacteria bacterium]MBW2306932.1 STAS domain-containing protein [Deltaproteobacteria bacterium]